MVWQLTRTHSDQAQSQAQVSESGHRLCHCLHFRHFWAQGLVPSQLQFQNAKSRLGQGEEEWVGPAGVPVTYPSIRTCTSGARALSLVRQHSNSV